MLIGCKHIAIGHHQLPKKSHLWWLVRCADVFHEHDHRQPEKWEANDDEFVSEYCFFFVWTECASRAIVSILTLGIASVHQATSNNFCWVDEPMNCRKLVGFFGNKEKYSSWPVDFLLRGIHGQWPSIDQQQQQQNTLTTRTNWKRMKDAQSICHLCAGDVYQNQTQHSLAVRVDVGVASNASEFESIGVFASSPSL